MRYRMVLPALSPPRRRKTSPSKVENATVIPESHANGMGRKPGQYRRSDYLTKIARIKLRYR
jgi:hypothetical protein